MYYLKLRSPGTAKQMKKLSDYSRCRIKMRKHYVRWRQWTWCGLKIAWRFGRASVWEMKILCGYFVYIDIHCSGLKHLFSFFLKEKKNKWPLLYRPTLTGQEKSLDQQQCIFPTKRFRFCLRMQFLLYIQYFYFILLVFY